MPTKKKPALSAASVLFMLLVIFIHTSAECVTGYPVDSAAFVVMTSANRIASFVVQGFLFLSGLKLFLPREGEFSYGHFALSRLRRVVLPYFIAFCAFYLVYALTGRIAPSAGHFLREFFTGGLATHFYFVAVIVQFYLLLPLWRLLNRHAHPALLCLVAFVLTDVCSVHLSEIVRLLFHVEISHTSRLFLSYLFYFIAGMEAGAHYDGFTAFLRERRRELWILWAVAGAVDCALLIAIRRGVYYPVWAEEWHIMTSILAILSVLALMEKYENAPLFSTRLFRETDAASYLVYLWHPLVILAIDALMNRIGLSSLTIRFFLRTAVVVPVAVFGCIGVRRLIGKKKKA